MAGTRAAIRYAKAILDISNSKGVADVCLLYTSDAADEAYDV